MAVEGRTRFLGIEAKCRIVLALPAVVRRIFLLQAAHQFPMTIEFGLGVLPMQFCQQSGQSLLLLWSACVLGRFGILGTAPNVAHAYAMSVMATLGTVGTSLLDGSALMD